MTIDKTQEAGSDAAKADGPKVNIVSRGADLIARRLAAGGVTTAFGVPGGEVLALIDALGRAGIRFVLTRHETAAGFMAEGLWHATGAPGLLVATIGPGVANAVNVVANALQDRVPLIVLTGAVDEALAESFTHQVFDHRALLAPITKATFRAQAGTEDLVIDKALAIALAGRPGPVHVDVPIGVAEGPASDRPIVVSGARSAAVPATVGPLRRLIEAAARPLVIAGLDPVVEGSGASLDRFLTATGAALLTTYKAKGIVDERDPRVVGGVGLSPRADRIVAPLIAEADLILLAGYDPIEMRAGWRHPWGSDRTVIDITADARPHGMHYTTHVVEAHVGRTLDALADGLVARPTWAGGLPARVRAELDAAFAPPRPWGPHAVFATLAERLPRDVRVTVDAGAHRILFSQMWRTSMPRGIVQSTGLCTMACAVPLAMGLAIGEPGRAVVAVVGDGGLEMGLGELATLRDLGLKVIILVVVDASLSLIELKQRQSQLANSGVDFGRTDFAAIARAFGGRGHTVGDRGALVAALDDALDHDGFTIIAAEVERRGYDGAF